MSAHLIPKSSPKTHKGLDEDLYNFQCIVVVSNPGNFWSWYTGLGSQKMSPKIRAVLYPEVSFLSCR